MARTPPIAAVAPSGSATRKSHVDGRAVALLLVCCAFWGFQQTLIKMTVAEVPPLWQASIRFVGATVLLLAWCAWRGVPLFVRDGSLKPGLIAGLLFAGEFCGIYIGLTMTTASRMTVFLYTSPFVVALLMPRIAPSERLNARQWAGLVIAFAAVALAFSEGLLHGKPGQWRGDALALGAGLMWGLTTLVIRGSVMGGLTAEKTLFYQVAVTAAVAPLVSLAIGESWSAGYSSFAWLSIIVQTAVGAFASYLAWMWMLRHYPATQIASYVFLTPMFALLFGVVLLGEPLTVQLLLALAGVATGIIMVSRRG